MLSKSRENLCVRRPLATEAINRPTTPSPPAKKHKAETPTSLQSPLTEKSSLARPTMAEAGTQTEQTKLKEKPCLGTNNTLLETFLEDKFGFTYADEEGYSWGEKQRGWTTFRARLCTGKARSADATRCTECHRLFMACSNAFSRHKSSESRGTQHYTPIASLKVSPHVKRLLEQYRSTNNEAICHSVSKDDDLEVEVSSTLPLSGCTCPHDLVAEPLGQRLSRASLP